MAVEFKNTKVLSAKTIAAFGEQARREWHIIRNNRREFYQIIDRLWTIYVDKTPVCVLGIKRNSLLGSGIEVFFMLCKKFNKHIKLLVRFLRRGLRRVIRLYGLITVRVENDYWIGERFVRLFGFVQKETVPATTSEDTLKVFEMRASWL